MTRLEQVVQDLFLLHNKYVSVNVTMHRHSDSQVSLFITDIMDHEYFDSENDLVEWAKTYMADTYKNRVDKEILFRKF